MISSADIVDHFQHVKIASYTIWPVLQMKIEFSIYTLRKNVFHQKIPWKCYCFQVMLVDDFFLCAEISKNSSDRAPKNLLRLRRSTNEWNGNGPSESVGMRAQRIHAAAHIIMIFFRSARLREFEWNTKWQTCCAYMFIRLPNSSKNRLFTFEHFHSADRRPVTYQIVGCSKAEVWATYRPSLRTPKRSVCLACKIIFRSFRQFIFNDSTNFSLDFRRIFFLLQKWTTCVTTKFNANMILQHINYYYLAPEHENYYFTQFRKIKQGDTPICFDQIRSNFNDFFNYYLRPAPAFLLNY